LSKLRKDMKAFHINKQHSRKIIEQLIPIINSDKKITLDEMDELYQLFTAFHYSQKDRMEILEELIAENRMSYSSIELKKFNINEKIILAKELVRFKNLQHGDSTRISHIIEQNLRIIKLPTKVLKGIRKITIIEQMIFKKWQTTDDLNELLDFLEDAAANISSISLPLAILYFFGITGFSGAGITSGLAAIGSLVGIGFSPMIGGLIVLFALAISSNLAMRKYAIPFLKKKLPGLLKKFFLRRGAILDICDKIIIGLKEDEILLKKTGLFKKHYFKKRKLAKTLNKLRQVYIKRKDNIKNADIKEGEDGNQR